MIDQEAIAAMIFIVVFLFLLWAMYTSSPE